MGGVELEQLWAHRRSVVEDAFAPVDVAGAIVGRPKETRASGHSGRAAGTGGTEPIVPATACDELQRLIEEQRIDAEIGDRRVRDRPMEILAGLNPHGMKRSRPRYFRSARLIRRRPQALKGQQVECGTATMYRYGCRCIRCRLAQSVRRKLQRAQAA